MAAGDLERTLMSRASHGKMHDFDSPVRPFVIGWWIKQAWPQEGQPPEGSGGGGGGGGLEWGTCEALLHSPPPALRAFRVKI